MDDLQKNYNDIMCIKFLSLMKFRRYDAEFY